ncbi:protein turtle homolog A isoform X1 [Talpa occidentalis]|uniref:protein turtle homolog A isoform X1 n=1 Tax=Talpa occidentalis TaxID=50954 RepID=UPI00188F8A88|nr:protein turtle homolog A isoform X1 [Talpa occidentalis]XP_037362583.1 protein turtle homolog A isoform X1 [Talpa occidentalis]XP_037362584.1 protein turtle homolog A isoform X1 [Talpa occidentalis]XP_037362587.1 protein turtle homolog A isoform X1 [Talpa occidentalis]XP_054549520.1 protein turtle homolog A isoform X1 [Talpa occidentalis]
MVWCLSLAVLSLLIGQGADGRGKPEVVSVVGRAGESAVLGCELPPAGRPPLHVIEWLRFGFLLPIFIQFGLYSPRIDPDYVGRVRLQKGASLQIEGLRAEDQGWYECRVLFLDQQHPEDENINGSWVHLTVNSPPRFLETPPQVLEVRELEPLTLRCVARGSPQPQVTWKLRGQDLGQVQGQVQVQNGTLWIRQVERGSSGVYTCQASSTEGSATHATQLLVLGPPVIVVPPRNSTVNASQDASLACRAEAYPANLTYTWFQDSINVFHISRLQARVRILVDGSLRLQAAQPDDAGRYTCVPSNGLLHPPSASAYLTVLYPAQVTAMPPETPLPIGMRGVIQCPARANPPLLFVSWTKDGQALRLDKFPGWSQGPEGSLIIALGNEDALGEYSCTPYNSLGTAGPSPVTRVLLKAPPAFIERPKEEYFQEVGRELLIPCSAHGDPPPTISWAKVGQGLQRQAQVDGNNSLILRPLTKEAHGRWKCTASNAVAHVATSTNVYVLGTSPHAVTNVSVVPLPKSANVSWEPGFDGGYLQRFSVWYTPLAKRPDRAHHDWVSLAVPVGAAYLLVPGLQPHTQYQFSVLAQNKLGSGPFSEIVLSAPEGLPTTPAAPRHPPTEMLPLLSPPRGLVAVRTPRGVLLHWDPPELIPERLDGYILEGRQGSQGWEVLDRAVAGTETQLLVPGLIKDVLYEFRLVAFVDSDVSGPSNTANISTSGLEVYPSRTQLPGLLPQPVLAGVLGGVLFLAAAVLVSVLAACLMNRRRAARRRRKRLRQDPPLIFSPPRKSTPHSAPGSGSPDSVVKLKLQASPAPSLRQSLLWGEPSRPPSPPPDPPPSRGPLPLEPICRGPDGRFVMEPNVETTQERSGPEPVEPRTAAQRQARSFDCSSSSPSGLPQPLCIKDISPVGPPPAVPPSPLPGPGRLLQYLSLPFFREMNVDGDWPPFEEPGPAPTPDYMDTRPCPTSSLLHPLDSPPVAPRAMLPGAAPEPAYTALTDWTLRERLLPSLFPAAPRGSLTSQSSGRGSASFLRPPSTAPSAGGSYLSPPPGDTSSWASGPERWPRREHVITVSKRRNTSVDENYEWDSEFPGDMELLETLHLGLADPQLRSETEPELGAKTPDESCLLNTAHAPGPEARCAALREEFLAFRRRRDATRARLPAYRQPVPHPEQATLL